MDMMRFREALRNGVAPGLLHWATRLNDSGKGDDPPAPNYAPVANASVESAAMMKELGEKQLAENQRQYDQNTAIAKPVVEQQLELMRQAKAQGDDYYEYAKANQRPLEQRLQAEALAAGSETEQETAAGKAIADARQGSTAMQNQLLRQGLRYGYSPSKLAANAGAVASQQGLSLATAANTAREKEKNTGYAKRLDVSGLYRNLPGASQGAYSLATNAGNSAVQNQMAPGQANLSGIAQGIQTMGSGRAMLQSGLGNVLNAQTNFGSAQFSGPSNMQGLGAVLGGAAQLYGAYNSSDRRMKEHIELVGKDEATGLNLYEFNYIGHDTRFRGVMADEVEPRFPDAVVYDDLGFAAVNYAMLGIQMARV